MLILDVSYAQPHIDYAAVAKQIGGVILRCGYTGYGAQTLNKDSKFEEHYKGFKAAGVPVGAYYYSCADTPERAEREANHVLALLKGKQFELPIYYDVENEQWQKKVIDLTPIVEAFCERLEANKYFVGYYSYTAWLRTKFQNGLLSRYTLWKADYTANPDKTIPCDMHQYTCKATINGIASPVDLSRTDKDFKAIIVPAGLNGFKTSEPEINYKELYEKEKARRLSLVAQFKKLLDGEDV